MNVNIFFFVFCICIQTASAQSSAFYTTVVLHEYKMLIIHPNLIKIGEDAIDADIDSVLNGALQDVADGFSATDKAALESGTDKRKLKSLIKKNFKIWEYETEAMAEEERSDYIKTCKDFGYAIYTIVFTSPPDGLKHIEYLRPLKGFNHYPANTIASMKESGKKHFYAALASFNLEVNHADWREYKIKTYQAKGYDDITDTIIFAEKDHDYFGKIDEKTGVRMIYELGYLPKDNGRGRVYEESFYMGMLPKVHASGTPAEQMAMLKGTFNNIRALIVKEVGNYTTSFSNTAEPYTEADLNDGIKFMKALQEGKLSYSTSWYSVGKQFIEKPVIYMEIHPSKTIKIKVTQNEVAE